MRITGIEYHDTYALIPTDRYHLSSVMFASKVYAQEYHTIKAKQNPLKRARESSQFPLLHIKGGQTSTNTCDIQDPASHKWQNEPRANTPPESKNPKIRGMNL